MLRVMQHGYSLLELVVALVVVSVLAAAAIPAADYLVNSNRSSAAINNLSGAVALARGAALTSRRSVRLCPGTGNMCGPRNTWATGMLAFTDDNDDRIISPGEHVIARLPGIQHGRLTWRAFRNRSDLLFTAYGLTDWLNGSFLYCPDNNDVAHARMLILNTAGRARHAPDRNGDGIREDASGRPLVCSAG